MASDSKVWGTAPPYDVVPSYAEAVRNAPVTTQAFPLQQPSNNAMGVTLPIQSQPIVSSELKQNHYHSFKNKTKFTEQFYFIT